MKLKNWPSGRLGETATLKGFHEWNSVSVCEYSECECVCVHVFSVYVPIVSVCVRSFLMCLALVYGAYVPIFSVCVCVCVSQC